MGYESLAPQGEAPGWEVFPDYGLLLNVWEIGQDCVLTFPTHFDVVSLLSTPYEGVTSPVLFFRPEEIIPHIYIAIDLVCLSEKVSSGSSYVAISKGN